METKVFIDGSSKKLNNIFYGGIGVYIPKINFKYYRGKSKCTNQCAELSACVKALKTIHKMKLGKCIIYSDSKYCINISTNWMYKWKENEWNNGKFISNLHIIKKIYNELKNEKNITFVHIKSHIKKPVENIDLWKGNKIADNLAGQGMRRILNRQNKNTKIT